MSDGTSLPEAVELKEIPKIFEDKCFICSQLFYSKTSIQKERDGAVEVKSVLYKALGVKVNQGFFQMFPNQLPLCATCSLTVGSLVSVQSQMQTLESLYDDLRSEIACTIVQSTDIPFKMPKKARSTASILKLFHKSEVETLHQLVCENWQDRLGDLVDGTLVELPTNSEGQAESEDCMDSDSAPLDYSLRCVQQQYLLKDSDNEPKDNLRKTRSSEAPGTSASKMPWTNVEGMNKNIPMHSSNNKNDVQSLNEDFVERSTGKTLTYSMSPNLFLKKESAVGIYSEVDSMKSPVESTAKMEKTTPRKNSSHDVMSQSLLITSPVLNKRANRSEDISKNKEAVTNDDNYEETKVVAKKFRNRNRLPLLIDGLEVLKNESGQFQCMFCPKKYFHKYPYRDHIKTHTGEGPKCKICLKIFPKNHNLMLHMRTHTGEKPFQCHVCTRKFADKSNLTVHMRGHTGERPYNCEFCGQAFVNSSRLLAHRRHHTGEKPFTCNSCNMTFTTKYQCVTHMKLHNDSNINNKPFRCMQCNKAYTKAVSLKAHISNGHKIKESLKKKTERTL